MGAIVKQRLLRTEKYESDADFNFTFSRSIEKLTQTDVSSRECLEAAIRIDHPEFVQTDSGYDGLLRAWRDMSKLINHYVRIWPFNSKTL